MTNRTAFHADESFVDQATGQFIIIRITENESGYEVASVFSSDLAEAQAEANDRNRLLGLTADDVRDIRTSSMRQHFLENPVVDDDPDIRIAIIGDDGTIIDTVNTCKGDLLAEIKRHPNGLLSSVNTNLL